MEEEDHGIITNLQVDGLVHSTTKFCPFEIVYGLKPIAPIDLLPLSMQERANFDASKRAEFVKKNFMIKQEPT